ncbi:MAG: cytochrome c [Alphaproteobacteria bacterium]|nr:cytochrome c [Alphaproteobacteria bacterium]
MTRERFGWVLVGLIVGIALAMLGITPSVGADLPAGQALVDLRHDTMKTAGGALQFLVKYDGSDRAKAEAGAKAIDDVTAAILTWFPEGSGPGGAGIEKTHAKADIWANWADFTAKAKAFDDASAELTSIAGGPDSAAIQAAAMKVGGTCKACHDLYREKDED